MKRLLSATVVALAATTGAAQAATITEFPLPVQDRGPGAIVTGADGNLWFTEQATSASALPPRAASITELTQGWPRPPAGSPPDPSGKLWFTEPSTRQGRAR